MIVLKSIMVVDQVSISESVNKMCKEKEGKPRNRRPSDVETILRGSNQDLKHSK